MGGVGDLLMWVPQELWVTHVLKCSQGPSDRERTQVYRGAVGLLQGALVGSKSAGPRCLGV